MEHPGRVVLHLRLLKVEILGLVVSDAGLQRDPVLVLRAGPAAPTRWPVRKIIRILNQGTVSPRACYTSTRKSHYHAELKLNQGKKSNQIYTSVRLWVGKTIRSENSKFKKEIKSFHDRFWERYTETHTKCATQNLRMGS